MSIKKDLCIRSVIGGGDADGSLRYWGEKHRQLSLDILERVPALQFPVIVRENLGGVVTNEPRMQTLLLLHCYRHPRIGFSTVGIVQLDFQPQVKGEHYDRLSNWICPSPCYLAGCLQDLASAVYLHDSYWRCVEVAASKVASGPFALNVTAMSRCVNATTSVL